MILLQGAEGGGFWPKGYGTETADGKRPLPSAPYYDLATWHSINAAYTYRVLSEQKRLAADLIVLGSHGHTALGEMLIGSVAHKVTVKSPVPVLLVPINQ